MAQTPLTDIQAKLLHTQCPQCKEGELTALDSIYPDAPFLWCPRCDTTINGTGNVERGAGITEYLNIPEVCPSSLDEWGWPMIEGNTAHKWDATTSPVTCAECGATKGV